MGTFQMSVLLSFNNSPSLSIKELQETTQLPEKELIKQVQSLLESKLIIVDDKSISSTEPLSSDKQPSSVIFLFYVRKHCLYCNLIFKLIKSISEDINENTMISLNLDFTYKRTKFKINAAVQKETPQVSFFCLFINSIILCFFHLLT